MMITTTLSKIRECSLCKNSWKLLNKNLGKDYGLETPLKFSQIIESNSLTDAVWCLKTIYPEYKKEVLLFAADCAENVLHIYEEQYPNDMRIRDCIKGIRDFANGKITEDVLNKLSASAYAASAVAHSASASIDTAYAASAVAHAAYAASIDTAYAAYAYAAAAHAAYAASAYVSNTDAYAAAAATDHYVAEQKFQKKLLIERFG